MRIYLPPEDGSVPSSKKPILKETKQSNKTYRERHQGAIALPRLCTRWRQQQKLILGGGKILGYANGLWRAPKGPRTYTDMQYIWTDSI